MKFVMKGQSVSPPKEISPENVKITHRETGGKIFVEITSSTHATNLLYHINEDGSVSLYSVSEWVKKVIPCSPAGHVKVSFNTKELKAS